MLVVEDIVWFTLVLYDLRMGVESTYSRERNFFYDQYPSIVRARRVDVVKARLPERK
jgi:hypothetical protein